MEKKLVSILIPVYNRVNLLAETINSAINQTYQNIEIIICDNCSTDGTWELLQKYSKIDNRIQIYRNSENIGPVKNWMKCIEYAKGKYSKLLFSDDLIKNTFIEHTLSLFDENTAFVFTPTQIFKDNIEIIGSISSFKSNYQSTEYLEDILLFNLNGFPVSPGCALFRTDDLKNSLLIDVLNDIHLDFKIYGAGNDLLLFLITAFKYKYVKVYPETESFFRWHLNSLTIANSLDIYYEYAKLYFIKNYNINYLAKFKTVLWIRNLKHKKNDIILGTIEGKKTFWVIPTFIFKKIRRLLC
jgi:glycosyltransferase involved in cell wall biosynthesis